MLFGTMKTVVDTVRSPQNAGDGARPRRIPGALLALLSLVVLAIGFAVGSEPQLSSTQLLLGAGAVFGVVFALIAVNRFWWLIVLLFAVRSSLDALKPSGSSGGLEAGTIVGGIVARVWMEQLYVSLVWIDDSLRGKGHGKTMMETVEARAREVGATSVWLNTLSWQARPFYEALGYTCFGENTLARGKHRRYFMRKEL